MTKYWRIASTCLSHDIFYASSCIFDDNMHLRNDIHQVLFYKQLIDNILYNMIDEITIKFICCRYIKIVSEYDQEIPKSQTADKPVAPRGRATQPSRDTRKTN